MIACVVFDFDGTLVLSNAIKRDAFYMIADRYAGGRACMDELLTSRTGDRAAILQRLDNEPDGQEFRRLWQLTPRQLVDELFESDAVKTLVLSQMAIPRGVGVDYGLYLMDRMVQERKRGHDIDESVLRERDPHKLIPPLHGALLKNEQDVHLLERLAFLQRREGRPGG